MIELKQNILNYMRAHSVKLGAKTIAVAPRRRLAVTFSTSPKKVWRGLQELQADKVIRGYYCNSQATIWEILDN